MARRGRPRKNINSHYWKPIYSVLAEIMNEITFHKSEKDYIKMVYFGNIDMLEKRCKKLLNIIELYKDTIKEQDDEIRKQQ